jgi:hypothetical protein
MVSQSKVRCGDSVNERSLTYILLRSRHLHLLEALSPECNEGEKSQGIHQCCCSGVVRKVPYYLRHFDLR